YFDTSFRVALDVLKDAQQKISEKKKELRTVRCCFVEKSKSKHKVLESEVAKYHDPNTSFYAKAIRGEFEEVVPEILDFIGRSFALTFIDPTGWTGYDYKKVAPLLLHQPGEVMINFMY